MKYQASGGSRIISTYVENTSISSCSFYEPRDHLHIRGEYSELQKLVLVKIGSSPHTWRILTKIKTKVIRNRIISTYVENTFQNSFDYSFIKDHLHIRGEYPPMMNLNHMNIGSSPHTWRIH